MRRRTAQSDSLVKIVPGSEKRMVGGRLVGLIDKHLRALRHCGAMPAHGNRQLLADHIVIAHLVAFFNPVVKSLRRIEDVFESSRARKRFALPRVPRSTLADAQTLFDPALLTPLIESLKQRLRILPHDPRLDTVTRQLIAVDGTFFAVAPRIAWALYHKNNNPDAPVHKSHVRVDLHFDILRKTPDDAVISGQGLSEQDALATRLQSNRFYVLDRGFQAYTLLTAIRQVGSDFLVRWRKDIAFDPVKDRPISAEDRQIGVLHDTEIRIRGHRAKTGLGESTIRRIEIQSQDATEPIILLTNRTDLSAHLIGVIYRHRWQIELFFRWLKCMANVKHFFSESLAGVTLQIYAAIIGTLLIAVKTGSQPNVYSFSTMSAAISGLIDPEDAPGIIARRLTICKRDAQRAKARRRAAKKQNR